MTCKFCLRSVYSMQSNADERLICVNDLYDRRFSLCVSYAMNSYGMTAACVI